MISTAQLDLPLDGGFIRESAKSPNQRWNGSERSFPYRGCYQIDHAVRAYYDPIHGIKVASCDSDHAMRAKSYSASISRANTAINQQEVHMSDQKIEEPLNQPVASCDPFSNLDAFKVGQDFNEFQAVIDYSVIPLRKPGKQQWFRVHPELKLDNVCFLEVEQDEGAPESFMLTGDVAPSLINLPGISKRSSGSV